MGDAFLFGWRLPMEAHIGTIKEDGLIMTDIATEMNELVEEHEIFRSLGYVDINGRVVNVGDTVKLIEVQAGPEYVGKVVQIIRLEPHTYGPFVFNNPERPGAPVWRARRVELVESEAPAPKVFRDVNGNALKVGDLVKLIEVPGVSSLCGLNARVVTPSREHTEYGLVCGFTLPVDAGAGGSYFATKVELVEANSREVLDINGTPVKVGDRIKALEVPGFARYPGKEFEVVDFIYGDILAESVRRLPRFLDPEGGLLEPIYATRFELVNSPNYKALFEAKAKELEDFKAKVVTIAMEEAEERDWCSEAEEVLVRMGLPVRRTRRVRVEFDWPAPVRRAVADESVAFLSEVLVEGLHPKEFESLTFSFVEPESEETP